MKKKSFFLPNERRKLKKMLLVMKFVTLFLLMANVTIASPLFGQKKHSFVLNQVTMKEAIDQILGKTDYYIVYTLNDVHKIGNVTVDLREVTVEEALKQVLEQNGLRYSIRENTVVISKNPGFLPIQQQDKFDVKGKVVDEKNLPIPGVSVYLKGKTTVGVVTDIDGIFALQVPNTAKGKDRLIVSFIGMKTEEFPIDSRTTYQIKLMPESADLEDVVVIGYGTMAREKSTTSISRVSGIDPEKNIGSDAMKALQGKIAGVNIFAGSGSPGAEPLIYIRGVQALSGGKASQPLYIVDGVVIDGFNFNINSINPQDIESIDVLKDAASSAIYGARGSTGVISITTKSGKLGSKTKVFVNAYTGINGVTFRPDVMNADEYAAVFMESRQNRIGDINKIIADPGTSAGQIASLNKEKAQYETQLSAFKLSGEDVDWVDEVINNAMVSNIVAGMSGGNDKTTYYFSLGRYSEENSFGPGKFSRMTAKLDLSQQVRKWLKITANFNASQTKSKGIQNLYSAATTVRPDTPLEPIYNEDGSYGYYYGNQRHPKLIAAGNDKEDTRWTVMGNVGADLKLYKGLSFSTRFNGTFISSLSESFSSSLQYGGQSTQGSYSNGTSRTYNYTIDNYFTYTNRWAELDASFTLGHTFLGSEYKMNGYGLVKFPLTGGITGPGAGSSYASASGISGLNKNTLEYSEGYFFRANLAWDNKYLLGASIRTDGSSKLPKGNRYGWFPAVSAGWVISRENFMENQEIVSNLKLRSSFGITGNIRNIDYFDAFSLVDASATYNNNPGLLMYGKSALIGNPSINWERTQQFDVGLDIGLLSNSLKIVIDYYNKATDGLLTSTFVPYSTGASKMKDNIGKVENKGIEFEIDYSRNFGSWGFGIGLNMNFNRNKVVEMKDDWSWYGTYPVGGPESIVKVGSPVGILKMYRSQGVNPETGDMMYEDLDGKAGLTSDDYVYINAAMPKFTGGLNLRANYKGFDLTGAFNFSYGSKIYDYSHQTAMDYTVTKEVMPNKPTFLNDRWRNPGDNAKYPRAIIGAHGPEGKTKWNALPSTLYLQDASFLRLRNLTLGYTLPRSLSDKIDFETLRVYVSAQNLFTISKLKYNDPESSYNSGVVMDQQPMTRGFAVGIDVTF